LLLSVDFGEISALQHAGDWPQLRGIMISAAQALERGGADCVVICTNTMHLMADEIAAEVSIPLLHIVDATARALNTAGATRIGLLGTAFTMEQDFYKGRMREQFGLDVIVPDAADRAVVHRVIYDELVQGRVEAASRGALATIMARLVDDGAQAIVLGCTELMLLVQPQDCAVPLFDTTAVHAQAAIDFALSDTMRIRPWSDDLAQAFHDINAQWIEAMFVLEEVDRDVLSNPRERIIAGGGDILFVEAPGLGIVGTCALKKTGDTAFELTKMGVLESARGLKAGEFLLKAALQRAAELGANPLYLLTSAKCAAAIHLYEKLGFVHDAAIMRDYGASYERCNVAMRYAPDHRSSAD
jgi:aspartate racemase